MARTNPGVTDHEDCSQTPRKTRMDPCKPMPPSTSRRGKHQRLEWTTSTVICIILLMSPADQCNATTSNNDRLPTIAEPQLTTSSHNQFASLLATAQTHFNTTKNGPLTQMKSYQMENEWPNMLDINFTNVHIDHLLLLISLNLQFY